MVILKVQQGNNQSSHHPIVPEKVSLEPIDMRSIESLGMVMPVVTVIYLTN